VVWGSERGGLVLRDFDIFFWVGKRRVGCRHTQDMGVGECHGGQRG